MGTRQRHSEAGRRRHASTSGRFRRVVHHCRGLTWLPCAAGVLGLTALAVDLARCTDTNRSQQLGQRFELAIRTEDWERAGLLSRRLGRLSNQPSAELNRVRFHLAQRLGDLATQRQLAQRLAPDEECGCAEIHSWRLLHGDHGTQADAQSRWLHHLTCLQEADGYHRTARTLLGWYHYRNRDWPAVVEAWQPLVRFDSQWLKFYVQAVSRLPAEQRQRRRMLAGELIVEASRSRLKGDWAAARQRLEEALQLLPQSSLVRNNLACAVLETQPEAAELAAIWRLLLDSRQDLELGWQVDQTLGAIAERLPQLRDCVNDSATATAPRAAEDDT